MKKTTLITSLILIAVVSVYGECYKLVARSTIESSNGQKIKSIVDSELTYTKETASFSLTPKEVRLWLEPRTPETEEMAKKSGSPIDGTPFSPQPAVALEFSFNSKTNSFLGNNSSEQSTIDLVNLIFYGGEKASIHTEDLAVMMPEYSKQLNFKISGHNTKLKIYWYDDLKSDGEKEAPTYILIVEDESGEILACRTKYQAFRTTTRTYAEFDLCLEESEIDLDAIVNKLNEKLNEGFLLKTSQ